MQPSCVAQPLVFLGSQLPPHTCLWLIAAQALRFLCALAPHLSQLLAKCPIASASYEEVSLATLGQTAETSSQERKWAQCFTLKQIHSLWVRSWNQIQGKSLSKNVLFLSLGIDSFWYIHFFYFLKTGIKPDRAIHFRCIMNDRLESFQIIFTKMLVAELWQSGIRNQLESFDPSAPPRADTSRWVVIPTVAKALAL